LAERKHQKKTSTGGYNAKGLIFYQRKVKKIIKGRSIEERRTVKPQNKKIF